MVARRNRQAGSFTTDLASQDGSLTPVFLTLQVAQLDKEHSGRQQGFSGRHRADRRAGQEIEAIADPAVRAATKGLIQSVMDLHGAAWEKALDIVSEAGEPGMGIIDRLGRDSLVSGLLILYGLHPEDLETRVRKAVDRVRPQLRKQGWEVEVLDITEGRVRLRVETGSHTCGSTAKTVETTLEGAIYDAAPDMTSLVIEGLEEKPSSGFVALDQLMAGPAGSQVPRHQPVALEPPGAD